MPDAPADVTVVAVEGDTVDLIAWRVVGSGYRAAVPAIYARNPGLAAHGATLPAGAEVIVPAPAIATEEIPRPVRLWD